MTNVGGGNGATRLTVADRVALRETCAGEATEECRRQRRIKSGEGDTTGFRHGDDRGYYYMLQAS